MNDSLRHPLSDIQSTAIGEGTVVWQYTVILPGAKIGRNCKIGAFCFIENDVVIGDNVTVKPYVGICDGVTLEDDVFIGPSVSFANDNAPKSRNTENYRMERIVVRKGASVGVSAVILPGVEIGENALVGAGSVVTKDVPAGATVVGNPAYVIGFGVPDKLSGGRCSEGGCSKH